jgi:SAM-dependent methyltransferase
VLYNYFQHLLAATDCGDGLSTLMCEQRHEIRSLTSVAVLGRYCRGCHLFYIGFDVNGSYIAAAQHKYGDRGTFVVGDTRAIWDDPRFQAADIVIGLGILHRLDDEQAAHCIRFAHRALKQGGRFVCLEACWIPNQGFVSRYVMSPDRDQHIRTEQTYCDLVQTLSTTLWSGSSQRRCESLMQRSFSNVRNDFAYTP